jgi:hypothetical protein
MNHEIGNVGRMDYRKNVLGGLEIIAGRLYEYPQYVRALAPIQH